MKNSLTFFLVICSYCCKAQDYIETYPTQFDTFIRNTSIEWAAYANDSIRFMQPNLSAILGERMGKGEIKTTYPIWRGVNEISPIVFTTKVDNEKMFLPGCKNAVYDSVGNPIGDWYLNQNPLSKIDSLSYNLLFIEQILYVENGKLKCYVPWVLPAFSVYVEKDLYLGLNGFFSTCLNFNYNFVPSPKNELLHIGQTKRKVTLDSISKFDMLKLLYGRNLLETIWPYILNSQNSIYSVATGEKINPSQLNNFIVSNDSITVAVFDSLGNFQSEKYRNTNPLPSYVPEVEIVEDWYYDNKNNLVFCEIPSMFLNVRRWKNRIREKEATPVLKIVFN